MTKIEKFLAFLLHEDAAGIARLEFHPISAAVIVASSFIVAGVVMAALVLNSTRM